MTGADRIAAAFAGSGKRAALMPYLMGGFPDLEGSLRIGEAYADAGADLVELGVPFSDPLADGPVIHAAGTAALRAGATVDGVLDVARRLSPRLPVVVMCYANVVLARTAEGFAAALREAGASGLIVPDLPFEEAPARARRLRRGGHRARPARRARPRRTTASRRSGPGRGGSSTPSRSSGTTGERADAEDAGAAVLARAKAHTDVPVALGFGIGTPEQAAAAAAAGADGVIVGSRLVRAAQEATDPPSAVREVVTAMAEALR